MKTVKKEMCFVWTQEKINDLIALYQSSECLWNVLTEDYKSREKRDSAIASICSTLNITREQFSKKIHNLRNQFNYEAKKVFKRNDNLNSSYRSKWEYYEKLLFLKNVIAPRPGPNYVLSDYEVQNASNSEFISIENVKTDEPQPEIVQILDTKSGNIDNVLIYQESSNLNQADSNSMENHNVSNNTYPLTVQRSSGGSHNESAAQAAKHKKDESSGKIKVEKRPEMGTRSKKKQLVSPSHAVKLDSNDKDNNAEALDLNESESPPKKIAKRSYSSNLANKGNNVVEINSNNKLSLSPEVKTEIPAQPNQPRRDEYELFGEFVANEMRNLNHDISRKKLKRRIMRAMLDTSNEDDDLD